MGLTLPKLRAEQEYTIIPVWGMEQEWGREGVRHLDLNSELRPGLQKNEFNYPLRKLRRNGLSDL